MHIFISIFLAVIWVLAQPVCSRAEAVGRFLKVVGQVELFKKGETPALAPKVQDGLEPGDVIETKTGGRAQVIFVDDSVLTIAPGSKVRIESYMYDQAKGSRNAVLQVFQGLVKTAVSRIYKSREPDFIMKTSTATMGVRGTLWYALLGPKGTEVYNQSGKLCVRNINPEVKGEVCLQAMERTEVKPDMPPAASMPFQIQDLIPLDQQLNSEGGSSSGGGASGGSSGSGGGAPPSASSAGTPFWGSFGGLLPTDFQNPSPFAGPSSGTTPPSPTGSVIKQWTGGSGWWDDSGLSPGASNWTSPGAPLNGYSAYLTQTDSINRTVRYNNTAPILLNELRIDATGSGNMTLRQDSPSFLAANNEYVGYQGRGRFLQSSGKNIVSNGLYLGYNPGSSGNYKLSGDGQLLAENLFVGHSGRGTFTQSGGVNSVTNRLAIAANPGSSGTYRLQGGSLAAGTIDLNPGGIFNQTGGSLNASVFNHQGGTVQGALENRGIFNYYQGEFAGRLLNYGAVNFHADFTAANGMYNPSPIPVTIGGGLTLTLNGAGLDNLGTIIMKGGTLTGSGPLDNQGLLYGYGNLGGAGGINNTGTMTFTGGPTTVKGEVTNQSQGQIHLAQHPTLFTGNVTNYGKVETTDTIVTWAGNFSNSGAYLSNGASQSFTNLTITPTGYLVGGAGDRWEIRNDFLNHSGVGLSWNTLAAALIFTAGQDTTHNVFLPGMDYGPLRLGYNHNFAWGRLDLTGQSLILHDGNSQAGGALYVGEIILGFTPEGKLLSVITGNGFNIYYDPELNAYLNGLIYELLGGGYLMPLTSPVPLPASAWLFLGGLVVLGLGRLRVRQRD